MRRRERKAAEAKFDTSTWQFQLTPVEEMDVEEIIAMDEYYSNQAPIGAHPLDSANNNEDIDLPF